MEQLPKEIKAMIGEGLSGEDLLKLCQTSKEMRTACQSSKFNNLWQQKLKEDFNMEYKNSDAYQEYLRRAWLHDQTFWVVFTSDGEEPRILSTQKQAINSVLDSYNPSEKYRIIVELERYFSAEIDGIDVNVWSTKMQACFKCFDYIKYYKDTVATLVDKARPYLTDEQLLDLDDDITDILLGFGDNTADVQRENIDKLVKYHNLEKIKDDFKKTMMEMFTK